MIDPLLNTKDAAMLLGIPESWLAVQARNGQAPCRRLGKYVRFDAAELRAWVDREHRSGPRVEAVHEPGVSDAFAVADKLLFPNPEDVDV